MAAYGSLALLLASCSSSRAPQPVAPIKPGAAISGPGDFNRPHKDGAPWWDVDVSRIPDAVPMPHYGPVKASPYTVFGKQYYPIPDARRYQAVGPASWYGTKFHGQATANGETYDLYGMTAAHKTLPLPSYVRVTNLENGKSAILRVNDRGPFYSDRIIDLSFAAAKKLGYAESGTARVKVEGIDPHEWWAQQGRPVPWCWLRRSRWRRPNRLHSQSHSRLSSIRRHRSSMPPRCSPCRLTQKKTLQSEPLACISKWAPSPIRTLRSSSGRS